MIDLIFVVSQTNRNSIAALTGALDRAGKIADNFNLKFADEKKIEQITDTGQKKIVCFSFQTPDVFRIQSLLKKIKKNEETILIAGGTHPSGAHVHTLRMGFDFAFIGEGEKIFIDFLREFVRGKGNYQSIKGVAFKEGEQVIFTGKSEPIDITKFLPVSEKFSLFTPIEITRGCPYGCRFCQTTYLFGRIRHRTINQIVESAKILVKYGWTEIRFVSPNILSYGSTNGLSTNLPKLSEMLIAVRKVPGVEKIYAGSFPSEVRPEMLSQEALLLLRKYSDNDNIIIGFQSGSDRILEKMHRCHTAKQALEAVEKSLDAGFKVNVDFMFSLPGETPEDEMETIKILEKLSGLSKVKIHGHIFLPLPGTPWQNERPGKISKKLMEILNELEKLGKLYGDWKEQEQLAERISTLGI